MTKKKKMEQTILLHDVLVLKSYLRNERYKKQFELHRVDKLNKCRYLIQCELYELTPISDSLYMVCDEEGLLASGNIVQDFNHPSWIQDIQLAGIICFVSIDHEGKLQSLSEKEIQFIREMDIKFIGITG